MLKAALRCYGLRCIDVRPEETPGMVHRDERSVAGMTEKASKRTGRASVDGIRPGGKGMPGG